MTKLDLNSLLNFGKNKTDLPYSPAANTNTDPVTINTDTDQGFDSLKLFGAASQGLTGLGALLQAYNGYKQLQLGRDAFDFQKTAYNQDSANQARMVNSELEDRQKARISSTGNNNANGTYESLGSYLDKNRVTAKQL